MSFDFTKGSSPEATEVPGSDPEKHLSICLILNLRVMPLKSIWFSIGFSYLAMRNQNSFKKSGLAVPSLSHIFRCQQPGLCSADWRYSALTVLTCASCSTASVFQCCPYRTSLEIQVHLQQTFLLTSLLKLTARYFLWVFALIADLRLVWYCTNLNWCYHHLLIAIA